MQRFSEMQCPRIIGIEERRLSRTPDILDIAQRFAHEPGTVALLSGGDLDCARRHIIGIWPWLTLSGRPGRVMLDLGTAQHDLRADPFDVLQVLLRHLRLEVAPGDAVIAGGLMGYLAYDLKDCLEDLPRTSVDDLHLPQMLLYAPSLILVQEKEDRSTRLFAPVRADTPHAASEAIDRFFSRIEANPSSASPTVGGPGHGPRANFSRAAYEKAVARVIEYIAAGDVYQVNLSQRFETGYGGDGFALFRRCFEDNPAPFFAFIQAGDHQIVSTSPERFLLRNGRRVETRPIKGTRPRGATQEEDAALRAELSASPKDDAELSMIVDLLRNDIGKVCTPGSVRVAEHKRLEAYRNVYHLVSVVEGNLEDGKDATELIKAAFPGGSITGCPKVRAMEIIDELEPCRRHVYCGAIGYVSFHDTLDLSVAIRTATLINGTLRFSVGGGIVFDSDPAREYEETLHKGRTLMTAGGASDAAADRQPMVWLNGRLVPIEEAAVPITDQGLLYGHGFFETLRADNGRLPLLADHLARFERTWRELMPGEPPDLTWPAIIHQVLAANGLLQACAAVKLLATGGSRAAPPRGHTLLVTARPYTPRPAVASGRGLRIGTYPHVRQTPLADYKTLNYLFYLRAGQWAAANGFDEALILNPDGTISETNTANLLLVHGRDVVVPASPAVLPGVMGRAACRWLAGKGYRVTQQAVTPEDLRTCPQVLAANALMGTVAVTAVDGRPRAPGDDLWNRINAALLGT